MTAHLHRVEEELLTPGAVASVLFVDPKTVTRWARAGKLDSIRTPGGHRRYRRSDIEALRAGVFHDNTPDLDTAHLVPAQARRRPSDAQPGPAPPGPPMPTVELARAVAEGLEMEAVAAADVLRAARADLHLAETDAATALMRARQARARATAEEISRSATCGE